MKPGFFRKAGQISLITMMFMGGCIYFDNQSKMSVYFYSHPQCYDGAGDRTYVKDCDYPWW